MASFVTGPYPEDSGLQALVNAILESRLPKKTPLAIRARNFSPVKVPPISKPSGPYGPFTTAPERAQLITWDPNYVQTMLNQIADTAATQDLPETLKRLEGIAAAAPDDFAHIRQLHGRSGPYELGINPRFSLEGAQNLAEQGSISGHGVGGAKIPMTWLYRGEDQFYPTRGLEFTPRLKYAQNFAGQGGHVYQIQVPTADLPKYLAEGIENQGYTLPPDLADQALKFRPTESYQGHSVFSDPLESISNHELGHALHHRMGEFARSSKAPGSAVEEYQQLMADMAHKNFNPETAFSRYANQATNKSLAEQAREFERTHIPEAFPEGPELRQMAVKQALGQADTISRGAIGSLPLRTNEALATEPFAEAFAAHVTPRLLAREGEQLLPTARNAASAGEQIAALLNRFRGAGFQGGAQIGTLANVAGGLGVGIAAPKIIDALIPDKNNPWHKALSGAVQGAGYGSILGPEGALAGAGIGALASQIL